MAKRTKDEIEQEDSDIDVSSTDEEELQEEDEGEGQEMINVDFDFFDLNPTIDFHATKNFIRQLFGDDNVLFSISELADLILTENHVGTTIKTEGQESDPFSLLSVVNISNNANKLSSLNKYILEKTSKKTEFNLLLRQLLNKNSKFRTGLIISERLINMPVETAAPMYRMLLEEMENSPNKKKEYSFDYFLIPSRVYELVTSTIDQEMDDEGTGRFKKSKKAFNTGPQYDYFHYEDEVLEKHAMYHGYFDFTNKKVESDGRRVFTEYGIDPKFSLILIDKNSLNKAAQEMSEKFPPF